MKNIKACLMHELETEMSGLHLEKYRARQIYSWLWKRGVTDFDSMTDISKDLRARLPKQYGVGRLAVKDVRSAPDGTTKLLFGLEDGESVETVFIPEAKRATVCVSTQVGCPLGCTFCASGRIRYRRNLAGWEIADQVLRTKEALAVEVSNVVLMGIGEPMLNLPEVFRAFEFLSSDRGLSISARHITVSTAGVVEGIEQLARSNWKVKLAVSLNATSDALRDRIMPVNRRYPLRRLLSSVKSFVRARDVRATFEYILIAGLNDRKVDARRLLQLLRGIPGKLNLIPFNEIRGLPYKRPSAERILEFYGELACSPMPVMLRKSRGEEIMAGCGQLRAAYG